MEPPVRGFHMRYLHELVRDKINYGVELHGEKDMQVIQLGIDDAMLFLLKSTEIHKKM